MGILIPILIILVILFFYARNKSVPNLCSQSHHASTRVALPKSSNPNLKKPKSIFVSVASYRDRDVTTTIENMFENAAVPEKVYVGLVTQNKDPEEHFRPTVLPEHLRENVRLVNIPHAEARGPCFARYLCAQLHRGEDFYLQIDSHTRFVKDWDAKLERMIEDVGDKVVLTHYPQSWDNMQETTVPVNDKAVKYKNYYKYKAFNRPHNGKRMYRESIGVAGGFIFAPSDMLTDCPMDSRLNYVFNGEEYLYSARLFTYGWKFRAPCENVVYHHYYRHGQPKFNKDMAHKVVELNKAPKIVDHLFNTEGSPYFGKVKRKQDYKDLCRKNV